MKEREQRIRRTRNIEHFCLLPADSKYALLFEPDEGGSTLFRNLVKVLTGYAAPHRRKHT